MLNNNQIKLVQTAVRAAGIRSAQFDGRYRLLLSKYRQPSGRPVTSCKELNNWQLDDLLAVCESLGWRQPGKPENFYRDKAIAGTGLASFAQQEAVIHLSGGLGWTSEHISNFINKMTGRRCDTLAEMTPREAFAIIEALKSIYNREHKTSCKSMQEFKEETSPLVSAGNTTGGTFVPKGLREARDGENQDLE